MCHPKLPGCDQGDATKTIFSSCWVNKKEWTHRRGGGACVSSSRVAFLSVHAVENMTVKTSETRHPENTQ